MRHFQIRRWHRRLLCLFSLSFWHLLWELLFFYWNELLLLFHKSFLCFPPFSVFFWVVLVLYFNQITWAWVFVAKTFKLLGRSCLFWIRRILPCSLLILNWFFTKLNSHYFGWDLYLSDWLCSIINVNSLFPKVSWAIIWFFFWPLEIAVPWRVERA